MRNICVFCGAKSGVHPEYAESAAMVGRLIAESGMGLVYGGGGIGLMGTVADATLKAGGPVTGVLPRSLMKKEIAHHGLSEMIVVDSLAERKQIMFERSDAFLVLPGGFGTLDELTEMITWGQLGFNNKPVGLLNVAGFYDGLIAFLSQCERNGLIKAEHLALMLVSQSAADMLEILRAAMPPKPPGGRAVASAD